MLNSAMPLPRRSVLKIVQLICVTGIFLICIVKSAYANSDADKSRVLVFETFEIYSSPNLDTTAPASAYANIDTIHFTVYDFAKGTIVNNQLLPIDRPFMLKIINVPDSIHCVGAKLHELDPRVKA